MAKTKKEVEVKKAPVKKSKEYGLEVSINDSVFKAEADSLKEALTDIITRADFPLAPKTRVFIKYSDKDSVKTKIMNTVMARRIFAIMAHKDTAVEIFTNKLTAYLEE